MANLNIFRNWGKAIGNLGQDIADKIVVPGLSGLGSIAGKGVQKIAKLGLDATNKLSKVDYDKVKKQAKERAERIGKAGSRLAGDLGQEAQWIGDAGSYFKYAALGDAPITSAIFGEDHAIPKFFSHASVLKRSDESLLGVKANWKGHALAIPAALAIGTPAAAREYLNMRKGQNDGQLYTNAPVNTYGPTMGHSYANNAGATGDLVFALHNQRHSGII